MSISSAVHPYDHSCCSHIVEDFICSANILELLRSPDGELARLEDPSEDALTVLIIEAKNYDLDLSGKTVSSDAPLNSNGADLQWLQLQEIVEMITREGGRLAKFNAAVADALREYRTVRKDLRKTLVHSDKRSWVCFGGFPVLTLFHAYRASQALKVGLFVPDEDRLFFTEWLARTRIRCVV